MDYFRTRELNGLSGPMYGIEYTQNDGESWITIAVHSKPEIADREMRGYVAVHPECALWDGSMAQKIFETRSKAKNQDSATSQEAIDRE